MLLEKVSGMMSRRAASLLRFTAVVLGGLLILPAAAEAQTGRIIGQVLSEIGEPLAGAEVTVVGTDRQALTDERGSFLILNVPAGTQRVQVAMIGYRTAGRDVVVRSGEAARVELRLDVSAVTLDEVVVTGQATGKARREIGTSIASIDAERLDVAPITTTSQLLQSRSPGVVVSGGGGNPGEGSSILLRGVGSISQNSEPIIYVDGVRIDNSRFEGFGSGATPWSGLDDIPPEDIARVEIIKGAAAATMYGTEASGGVIQIFTKQGIGEPQRWTLTSEYGVSRTPKEWWDISIYSPWYVDEYVGEGNQQRQVLSVRGSVRGFSYNASGTYGSHDGMLPNSESNSGSFRGNMRFMPSEKFSISANTGYATRGVLQPQSTALYGYTYNGLGGGPRGVRSKTELAGAFETRHNSSRFTAGLRLDHTPVSSFNHRVTIGTDLTNFDNFDLTHWGEGIWSRKWAHRREASTVNVDYGASLRADLTPSLQSKTAAGFQAYSRKDNWLRAIGYGLPGPVETIDAMSVRRAGDSWVESKSAGMYGEQQLGFRDILFVTGGLRADGHSAFGEDFSYQLYPKADVSYVVSEQGFWPEALGTMRLRAAYGTAGRQPATFAAQRTWVSVTALEGRPGFTTGNLGNPDLAPEVSREVELGFDAGVVDNRINLTFTYYDQKTDDALYSVLFPPSMGFLGRQMANVGEVANQGYELALRGAVLRGPALRWNVNLGYSTNENEVVSLGDAPPDVGGLQQIREGYPVRAYFGDRHIVVNGEVGLASELLRDANGELPEGWDYLGSPYPKHNLHLGTDVTIARNLSLSALVDFRGGHHLYSGTARYLTNRYVKEGDEMFEAGTPIANWCREPADARMEVVCETNPVDALGNFVMPADNWHLREVSLSYRLPQSLLGRMPVSGATLSVAGRNLWRQQDYIGLDADTNSSASSSWRTTLFNTPTPQQFTTQLQLNF